MYCFLITLNFLFCFSSHCGQNHPSFGDVSPEELKLYNEQILWKGKRQFDRLQNQKNCNFNCVGGSFSRSGKFEQLSIKLPFFPVIQSLEDIDLYTEHADEIKSADHWGNIRLWRLHLFAQTLLESYAQKTRILFNTERFRHKKSNNKRPRID